MQYLGDARKVGNISIDDLNSALLGVTNKSLSTTDTRELSESSTQPTLMIEEHVAIVKKTAMDK